MLTGRYKVCIDFFLYEVHVYTPGHYYSNLSEIKVHTQEFSQTVACVFRVKNQNWIWVPALQCISLQKKKQIIVELILDVSVGLIMPISWSRCGR